MLNFSKGSELNTMMKIVLQVSMNYITMHGNMRWHHCIIAAHFSTADASFAPPSASASSRTTGNKLLGSGTVRIPTGERPTLSKTVQPGTSSDLSSAVHELMVHSDTAWTYPSAGPSLSKAVEQLCWETNPVSPCCSRTSLGLSCSALFGLCTWSLEGDTPFSASTTDGGWRWLLFLPHTNSNVFPPSAAIGWGFTSGKDWLAAMFAMMQLDVWGVYIYIRRHSYVIMLYL